MTTKISSDTLSDLQGFEQCVHPECGRYEGPQGVECRAMAADACARPSLIGSSQVMVTGDMARVYDVIGLHHSQPLHVLLANFENIKRFADYLDAIGHAFFMVPGKPSDEPEDEGAPVNDVCLVSPWSAASVEEYVEQFRQAILSLGKNYQGHVAAWQDPVSGRSSKSQSGRYRAPLYDQTTVDRLNYKAELYDEVWALATGLGYLNVTTAISKLRDEVGEAKGEYDRSTNKVAALLEQMDRRETLLTRSLAFLSNTPDLVQPGAEELAAEIRADLAGAPVKWNPMHSAPTDGTIVRLLVRFTEHSTEDDELGITIGANGYDDTESDEWQFAGWCWQHDHFTQGEGTPIGWLPLVPQALSAAAMNAAAGTQEQQS